MYRCHLSITYIYYSTSRHIIYFISDYLFGKQSKTMVNYAVFGLCQIRTFSNHLFITEQFYTNVLPYQ